MDSTKSFYLDLEGELHTLTSHFLLCEGASDSDVVDWARFYVRWAEKSAKKCGPWSQVCLEHARNILQSLERSKKGHEGYEALGRAMQTASQKLATEIKGSLLSEVWV
jgi:hypothetical protein